MQNAYSPMSTEKIAQFVKANFPKLSMKQQIELTQYVIEEGGLSYVSKQDMQEYVSKYMKKGNAMTNNLEAKKLAVIKSNAAPVKSPSASKVASGNYRGGDWYMWKDGEKFVGQLVIELGKTKERKYMAEAGSTQEQALQKLKQRADKTIEDWNKKWPNDMHKNNLEAKKLAVIKSNAAPEVKLKALEKLNAVNDKLAGPKKALSALLGSLGYAQMSKDVLKETELEKLKPYARAVLSDMQKQTKPAIKDKLPRVQELLSKLGVL